MTIKTGTARGLFAAAISLMMLLVGPAIASGNSNGSACKSAARNMFAACYFDSLDNFNETIANCRNIADRDERSDCNREARAVRPEDREECINQREARMGACELLGETYYDPDPLMDPANTFIDPDDVPSVFPANPYVSVAAGHTFVLRGGDEIVVVHGTEDVREILGVQCRVVVDIVVEVSEDNGAVEYEPVEATEDWFAQDNIGNVYYCGEIARNYEDGVLRDLDGSFEAGLDYAKSGTLIRVFPVAGDAHRTEFALGEAEDIVQYVGLATAPGADEGGDNPAFPCSPDLCLKTYDFAPLDPASTEFKYWLPGTGFVLAVSMEDGELTGEREELVCVGESLDILQDPNCEITDPDGLLEELCKLSPDAFCE
jgi:hypothetical protein